MTPKIALYSLEFYVVCVIGLGAVIMGISILWVEKIKQLVPAKQAWKWQIINYLMIAFLLGYVLLGMIITYQWPINRDILAGLVFLGGAVFVFMVMDISYSSIKQLLEIDELKRLNSLLEEKGKDLADANDKLGRTFEEVVNFSRIANEVSQGNMDIDLPEIKESPELNELSASFGRMIESLKIAMKAMEE